MGFPGMTTLVCPQNPSEPAKLGYHAHKYVSIWDNGNRVSVTVDTYMAGVEAMKPNAFVALCDGETPKDSAPKRIAKSATRTIEYLDDTHVVMSRSTTSASVFAAIEGGYDAKMRRTSAELTSKRCIIGFMSLWLSGAFISELAPTMINCSIFRRTSLYFQSF